MIRAALVLALSLSGCSATGNPCPRGSEPDRSGDRCVRLDPSNDFDASSQGSDAGALTDADLDASPGPDGYTGPDAHANAELDACTDASFDACADASDGATDDASLVPAPRPLLCPAEDVTAWRNFHLMPGVVDTINACLTPCSDGDLPCNAEPCLREAAGLTSCFECPVQETTCTLEFCWSACGRTGNDEACLACVCEAGCVAQFDSCAQASLNLCSNVHGRDAAEHEFNVTSPWLIRMKSGTGFLQTAMLQPNPPGDKEFTFTYHHSKGFTHAVPFSIGSRHFLLQYKSVCGNDPCLARISPFLSDGSLGRPVFSDTWSRGWDELETFSAGTSIYLLRYKTGSVAVQDEAADHLRIDEIKLSADGNAISLQTVLNEPPSHTTARPWTAIETFSMHGTPYLLRYSSTRGGDVQVVRVNTTRTPLALVPASNNLAWSRGFDVVETFTHAGSVYVLTHKSSNVLPSTEPLGSTQVFQIFLASADTTSLLPILQATLPAQFRRIVPFVHDRATYFLMQDALPGRVVLRQLSEDPLGWATDTAKDIWTSRWGTNPIWDMIEVVQGTQETLEP